MQVLDQLVGMNLAGIPSPYGVAAAGACSGEQDVEILLKQGPLDKAVAALLRCNTVPSAHVYKNLLHACTHNKTLAEAKSVCQHLLHHGLLESDAHLGSLAVTTLLSCGSLADGLQVFRTLSHRSVFAWTAIISGYCNAGNARQALAYFDQMQQDGVQPDTYTLVTLLKACTMLQDLQEGRRLHAHARALGLASDVFVGSTLVSMYAKCGSVADAHQVFHALPFRNVVSWNAMLAAYAQQEQGTKALDIYRELLQQEGIRPDARTFVAALQACGSLAEEEQGATLVDGLHVKVSSLHKGRQVHAQAREAGFGTDVYVGNTLVSMYSKCGSIRDAHRVFEGLAHPNVVSWSAMIAAHAQQDEGEKALRLFWQMQEQGFSPAARTFVSALQACGSLADREESVLVDGQLLRLDSLRKARELHAGANESGFASDLYVQNTVVSVYAKCGSIMDAQQVFDELSKRNLVSWNGMLAAYAQQDQGEKALQLFWRMEEEGIQADPRTFVSVLQACGNLADKEESVSVDGQNVKVESLQRGRHIHARASQNGCESHVFVQNTLVSMYAKCGSMREARHVFEELPDRNVVSWNAMLAAYAQQGEGENALQIYEQMQEAGVRPMSRTFVSALQACGSLAEEEEYTLVDGQNVKVQSLCKGKQVHARAVIGGFVSDSFVANTLVSMYAKCGSIQDAEQVFDDLTQRDVVSWNAMIAAYAQEDQGHKALQLYSQMQAEGVTSNEATFVAVLEACSSTGALEVCAEIHQCVVENGWDCSSSLATSLIDAYGKCGSMVDAHSVFQSLARPNVVSWTALLAGYARIGDCAMSIKCYEDMCTAGVKPDRVTFLALLAACSHAGMVDEGLYYFDSMFRDHGIRPELEHYACMIDLVGRAGLFSKAEDYLSRMPMPPNLAVWLCLLGACRTHGNVLLGKTAFHGAASLDPKHTAAYVLMSTIYADAGMHDCAREIDDLRQRAGAWKKPGRSCIEHDQELHTFVVGDHSHPQAVALHRLLDILSSELKGAGYVPRSQ